MAPNNTWRTILPSCFKMELELLQHAKKEEEDPKINHHLLMKKNTLFQQHKQQQISSFSSRMSLSDINIMSFNNSSSADSNSSSSSSSSIFLSNYLAGSNLHAFTLAELKKITQDFSPATFLGEGGFGPVHKGFLLDHHHHHHHIMIKHGLKPQQPVAVKLLNLQGTQGHKEWLAEIILLGQLSHPHVVKLIGYCWEDEQRLLIYEYMPGGNLEDQLFSNNNNCSTATDNGVLALPWSTRLQIALGVAKALAFLHGQDKPVIYRDFKTSNILLDSDFTAKISDFGLAKDGPQGDETHVTTRVMGTHGYAAPEYVMTGHLTKMSDVYSFGVVLLELMTGRKALDKNRPRNEQSLVEWARPFLKDPVKLEGIMDTRLGLKGPPDPDHDHDGPKLGVAARKTASLAHQCLSQQAKSRPTMLRVVKALETIINLHNSFNNNNNNNIQLHNVYVDQTKDQKFMIKEFHEDYKLRNKINIIIDQEEEEEEQEQDQGQKKKQRPRRKGYRHKHRLSSLKYSRTVSSDTTLYPTLVQNDQSRLLYQHSHDNSI